MGAQFPDTFAGIWQERDPGPWDRDRRGTGMWSRQYQMTAALGSRQYHGGLV